MQDHRLPRMLIVVFTIVVLGTIAMIMNRGIGNVTFTAGPISPPAAIPVGDLPVSE